jgi:hypothetical protein
MILNRNPNGMRNEKAKTHSKEDVFQVPWFVINSTGIHDYLWDPPIEIQFQTEDVEVTVETHQGS